MDSMTLADRAAISVSGSDATTFLQGLLSADLDDVAPGRPLAAALLTPQGKVLFDMLILRGEDGYVIDCRAGMADALATRLGFYRLRAHVEVAPASDLCVIWAPPGAAGAAGEAGMAPDPRLAALGVRGVAAGRAGADAAPAYHALRIAQGVAEAGADYESGAVFPHEASLDLLGGVSFTKGCFVGQEVVSRMHHRATARKRFLPCAVAGELPALGTAVTAGGRTIGTVGSSAAGVALALLRLDHLEAALREGTPVLAAGTRLTPLVPDWLAATAGALAGALA